MSCDKNCAQQYSDLSNQLRQMSNQLRSIRIQVMLLALKDTKQKHPKVVILENRLDFLLAQPTRNNYFIDECLDELEAVIVVKPEHHKIAQQSNGN